MATNLHKHWPLFRLFFDFIPFPSFFSLQCGYNQLVYRFYGRYSTLLPPSFSILIDFINFPYYPYIYFFSPCAAYIPFFSGLFRHFLNFLTFFSPFFWSFFLFSPFSFFLFLLSHLFFSVFLPNFPFFSSIFRSFFAVAVRATRCVVWWGGSGSGCQVFGVTGRAGCARVPGAICWLWVLGARCGVLAIVYRVPGQWCAGIPTPGVYQLTLSPAGGLSTNSVCGRGVCRVPGVLAVGVGGRDGCRGCLVSNR